MNQLAVKIESLSKTIKGHTVLEGISLEVPKGKIYGLVGRNGSGKTMLLRAVCGLIRPTGGRIIVFGEEIGVDRSFPKDIGAIIEKPGFLPHLSGMENLQLLAMIRNQITRDDIANSIRLVGLDPELKKPVNAYSLGMKQRLGLAQAIMEKPELLVLDEPTNGLDVAGVKEIRIILRQLAEKGATILIASHNSEDIAELCDKVFRMESGRLSKVDSSATSKHPISANS